MRQAEAGPPAVEPAAQPASPASSAASLLPGEEPEEDEAFCTPAAHLLATPEEAARGMATPPSAPIVPRLNLGARNAAGSDTACHVSSAMQGALQAGILTDGNLAT